MDNFSSTGFLFMVKLVTALTLIGMYYELKQLSFAVGHYRVTRFINRLCRAILICACSLTVFAFVEYSNLVLRVSIGTFLTITVFFVYITYLIRRRRIRIEVESEKAGLITQETPTLIEAKEDFATLMNILETEKKKVETEDDKP